MLYSRNGKIPRHQRSRHPNWLLHSKHPPPSGAGLGDRAGDPLRLAGEPPRESQRVLDLALRLGERLARLVRDDAGQVVPVLADQGVPSEEPPRAGARVLLAVALECGMCCVHGGVYI